MRRELSAEQRKYWLDIATAKRKQALQLIEDARSLEQEADCDQGCPSDAEVAAWRAVWGVK